MWSDTSQRELLHVDEKWTIERTMQSLLVALRGDGPALAFGKSTHTHVPEKCAVVVTTSGSSGVAKEVALSASALVTSARNSNTFLGATPGDRWSLLLPITHIAGINVLLRSLELGTIPLTQNSEVEFTAIVPTQLHRALTRDRELLEHLKKCKAVLVGGAASDPSLLATARSAGIKVVTTYGMTEMSGGCVYNNKPLQGISVRINSAGCVELSGPTLAMGYLSRESFGEWFATNDLGEFKDGELFIRGRADDTINTGGEKISLSAIDDFLHEHFPRHRFASFVSQDSEWGEKLHLACDGSIEPTMIINALKEKFGNYAAPKEFHVGVEIPLLGIGKPDRKSLAVTFGNK